MMTGKTRTWDGGLTLGESPVYVGIDQSYTGFGLTAMADTGEYYTWVYTSGEKGIARLDDIERWVEGILVGGLDRWVHNIAMEAPVRMSHSALMSGELFGVIRLHLYRAMPLPDARLPLQVPPAMLKKYVTGKGTGVQKNQMLLETYKRWGADFSDDNAADSYGLARIAAGLAETDFQNDILKKLRDTKYRDAL